MSYPSKIQVSEFFANLEFLAQEKITVKGLEYIIIKGDRKVRLIWEEAQAEEFWFSLHQGDRCDLVDWVEMFENEDKNDLFKYLEKIISRYLERETKVFKFLGLFGKGTLKYFESGKWHELRSPI